MAIWAAAKQIAPQIRVNLSPNPCHRIAEIYETFHISSEKKVFKLQH